MNKRGLFILQFCFSIIWAIDTNGISQFSLEIEGNYGGSFSSTSGTATIDGEDTPLDQLFAARTDLERQEIASCDSAPGEGEEPPPDLPDLEVSPPPENCSALE